MPAKIRSLLALIMIAALLVGCRRTGPAPLHVIYIVDLTASTIEDAREKAFEGVTKLFDKGLLKRGDSITVIPITGDALTESQGAILRFEIPLEREIYDDDLRTLSKEVVDELRKMQEAAALRPYPYSDIIGAVRIANEEFAADKPDVRKVLIVLSDFVEDEKQLSFKNSPLVANEKTATEAAKKMSASDHAFKGARVYLGWLRSSDMKTIVPQRRDAIRTFWTEYFKQAGAKSIHVSSDGPGQLTKFIAE
jgi:hypothetical protein